MVEQKQQAREFVTGSKVWYDYHFNTGKDILNDFYHKYDLKLDMQKCLENQHQASTIVKSADKQIIICRYLHTENGVSTRGDCLNIILTPNNVITLRRSTDNLLSSLTDSFSSITNDKMKPEAFVDVFLQKAYNSTLKVITDVEAEISTLQENYEKNGILPLSKDLAHWQAVLGEATSIVSGHQQLLNSLHQQIVKSGKEDDFSTIRSFGCVLCQYANGLKQCYFHFGCSQQSFESVLDGKKHDFDSYFDYYLCRLSSYYLHCGCVQHAF
jgi:hypothetical protein